MDHYPEEKSIRNTRKLVVALVVTLVIMTAVGLLLGWLIYSVMQVQIGPEHFGIPTR